MPSPVNAGWTGVPTVGGRARHQPSLRDRKPIPVGGAQTSRSACFSHLEPRRPGGPRSFPASTYPNWDRILGRYCRQTDAAADWGVTMFDSHPEVAVTQEQFLRALGFPVGHSPSERVRALMEATREWYEGNGRPWFFVREAESLAWTDEGATVEGVAFRSAALAKLLAGAEAYGAALAAVCAGREIEAESQRHWEAGEPDQYYFLETFAVAVVEQLMAAVSARLGQEADGRGLSVLRHLSPGYAGWPLSDQVLLVRLMQRREWPAGLDFSVLPSGQLLPKKSHVALFGLAPKSEHLRCRTEMIPCESCGHPACAFRRAHGSREAQVTLENSGRGC
jgi:hypothetical protein